MPKNPFRQWSDSFRLDAEKDGMMVLRNHLQRVGLPDEPDKLLDGTIMFMSACYAYLTIDGRSIEDFLAMQAYRPTTNDSHYSFTFNLCDRTYGRIITALDIMCIDLADLFGHPWDDFKMCGYSDFRVARIDEFALTGREIEDIEKAITSDIRYDYSEDEVEFWTDPDSIDGVLYVHVYDVTPEDEETK